MRTISSLSEFKKFRDSLSGNIGLIPTMGALHDGHLSLVNQSNQNCDHTIVSIFVNPTQFAQGEDLKTYPRSLEKDLALLETCNVDAIFLPTNEIMYPGGFSTFINEVDISKGLEGKSRPTFFRGVTTIIAKLFNIINPTHAFFGEKDAQQLRIIQKLVNDLNYSIQVVSCPIIREKNGLAMSSRNNYLSVSERSIAATIYKSLEHGKNIILSGERNSQLIRDIITRSINAENLLQLEYVSVADSTTLLEISGKISGEII